MSLRVRSGEELDCKVTRSLVEFELRFFLFSYCRIRLVFEGDDRKQHVVSGFSTIGSSTVDYKVFFFLLKRSPWCTATDRYGAFGPKGNASFRVRSGQSRSLIRGTDQ